MTKKQIKEFPPKIKKETLTKPPWNQQTSKGEPGIVSPPQFTVLFWHAPGSWKPRNVEPLAIIPWCQLTQQRTWLAAGCLGCLQSIWKVASANYTMKLQPADQITADGIPTHAVTRKHPTTGYNHTCKLVSHVFTYPISFGPLILGPFLSSSDEIMVSPSSTPGSAWSLWSTPPSWPAEFVWWRQSTWPKSAGSKYIHGFSPDFTQVTVGKGSSGFLSTTRIAKWLKWDLLTDAWDLLTDVLTHESNECPWVSTCQKPLLHLGCMIISTDQLY
jgi:hypothetical protein